MSRKKLLATMFMFGIVGVLASSGTYAWFFDDEVSTDNRFQTGTIDIEVEDVTPTAGGDPKIVAEPDGHNLLKPSQVGYLTKTVTNVGNNPAKIFKRVAWTRYVELLPQPESEQLDPHQTPSGPFTDYIDFDLEVDDAVLIPYSETTPTINTSFSNVNGNWVYLGTLAPGAAMRVRQSFHLQNTEGDTNWAQDDQLFFNEDFKGLQVTGATSPTPEFTLP